MSVFHVTGDGFSSLFDLLAGKFSLASCGGNGTCGKCLCRVIEENRSLLACQYYPAGECTVEIADEGEYRTLSVYDVPSYERSPSAGYGIGIDIGTTTIALELVDLRTGSVVARDAVLNSQRRFGSDVLSRIQASIEGFSGELQLSLQTDIQILIQRSVVSSLLSAKDILYIALAGNTTMIHLLLGLSCASLGVSPFTPVATAFREYTFLEVFSSGLQGSPELSHCTVRIVPSISTFVGGDIVAGLASLNFGSKDYSREANGPVLFLDLGTNAEIVLYNESSFWCTSASAGPAFEGGNISCGTGSITGAVYAVTQEKNRFSYSVIGGDIRSPVGLCGSGLLDFVACALDFGLIEKSGSVSPVCQKTGIVLDPAGTLRLLPCDIREVQLAKAAIRAGIEVLLLRAGIHENDISRVYLSGGFGYYLKEASALRIGLFPPSFAGKIHSCGNTSLAGAVRFLQDISLQSNFDDIIQKSISVQLADEPSFNRIFIDSMEF